MRDQLGLPPRRRLLIPLVGLRDQPGCFFFTEKQPVHDVAELCVRDDVDERVQRGVKMREKLYKEEVDDTEPLRVHLQTPIVCFHVVSQKHKHNRRYPACSIHSEHDRDRANHTEITIPPTFFARRRRIEHV